ncbi:hypothetical protein FACS1894204_04140 [Synergistales bacterium]|nr:hypothetical protein FACS1894204_04140 [Synergistales bacterium]
MDNYEKLEIKLDTMNETMRSMLDLNRQTLTEIKKQNDVMGSRLSRMEHDIEKASESRKEIYERIEKIEHRCAVRETALPIHIPCGKRDSFSDQAQTWVSSKVGQWVISVGISGAVMATIIEVVKAFLKR